MTILPPASTDETPSGDPSPDLGAPHLAQVDEPGGWGKLAARILVAAILISLAIAAYFYFGQRKPVATGDVARISLYPIHSVISGQGPGSGMSGEDETYDQLLVFAQVHVHNLGPDPLTITEFVGDIVLPTEAKNGEGAPTSRAASRYDFDRLFAAYPRLAPLRMDPLQRDTVIAPGQTVEGLLVFNYSMSKEAWEQRKGFSVTVSFSNGVVIHIDGTHA